MPEQNNGNAMLGAQGTGLPASAFESILNNTDVYLYVDDPETGELLFVNEKYTKEFNLPKHTQGAVCWETMHPGQDKKCAYCPLEHLRKHPDDVMVWEKYNARNGRYYKVQDKLIDWHDGRRVHLQHRTDITDEKKADSVLERRLEQQEIMSAISQNFVSNDDIPTLISKALDMSGKFMDIGKILLSRVDVDAGTLTFEYEWYSNQPTVKVREVKVYPFCPGDPLYETFVVQKRPYAAYDDVEKVPHYTYLAEVGIYGIMSVPIYNNEKSGAFYPSTIIKKAVGGARAVSSLAYLLATC